MVAGSPTKVVRVKGREWLLMLQLQIFVFLFSFVNSSSATPKKKVLYYKDFFVLLNKGFWQKFNADKFCRGGLVEIVLTL